MSARGEARSLPDRLTYLRLWLIPPLWFVAAIGATSLLGVGVAIAAFTDLVDGPLARRLHQTSPEGSRLDSIADHTLTASTAVWLLWRRTDFVLEQLPLLTLFSVVGATTLLVGWKRFRKIGDLHLYSAKTASLLGYLFAIWILMFGSYNEILFYFVIAIALVACVETLLVMTTEQTVDEHMGSILLRGRRPNGRGRRESK